jgi:sulfofructose kinase
MLIVGAICETSIYRVAEVSPLPSKALASDMCQIIDGMALSAAYDFVKLGGSAQVCARIGGGDLGAEMRRSLTAEGFDTSSLHCIRGQ